MTYHYRVVRITQGMSDNEINKKIKEMSEQGYSFWEIVSGESSFMIFRKASGTTVISE